MILIDLNNKPEWYKKLNPAGTVPTLEFDDQTINDSYEILEYLDTTYPDPPLNPPSNKEAEEITGMCVAIIYPSIWAIFSIQLSTSNSTRCPSIHPSIHLSIHSSIYPSILLGTLFSTFSAWIKNKEESNNTELEVAFTAELQKINDYLGRHSWVFLCSDQWSIADCVFVPRLYHIKTVAEHYRGYTKHQEMPNLVRYMETVFSTEEFEATSYPQEYIIQGWAKYM